MRKRKPMPNPKVSKQMTIPIFIPHMGCGHSCTFCNQRTISGIEREPEWTERQVRALIDGWLSRAENFDRIEIAYFGGSFTGIPVLLQEHYLSIADTYIEQGLVHGIRLSTRPDYLDDSVLQRLKAHCVTLVEIGVQSYSDLVLKAAKRGHNAQCIEDTLIRLRAAGIPYGIQLMIGLPGDTYESWMKTVEKTIEARPACVRIYPTLVLEDTELGELFKAGHYQPLKLEEAVDYGAEAYTRLMKADIPVIRMGLQASEDLSKEGSVLAGPYHDAFRSLVETELYKRMIKRDLENGLVGNRQYVRVNSKHVSFFSGHKKSNLEWLKSMGIQILKIEGDSKVTPYEIKWVQELNEAEVEACTLND